MCPAPHVTDHFLQVAFYARPAEEVAEHHPPVRALLQCAKARSGCYLCSTQQLANAAGLSPSEVGLSCKPCHSLNS